MTEAYPGMRLCLADGGADTGVDMLTDVQSGVERDLVLRVDGYVGPLRVAPYATVAHVDAQVHLTLGVREAATLSLFDPRTYGTEAGVQSRPRRTIGTRHGETLAPGDPAAAHSGTRPVHSGVPP